VQELLDKQEVHDVLLRYCRGLDRGDAELVRAAFHPDGIHDVNGTAVPIAEMVEGLKRPTRKVLRSLAHYITNERVDLQGDTAFSECYFLACHRVEHEGAEWTWIVGGRYLDRLERRGGVWLIAHRAMLQDWARTDKASEVPADLTIAHSTDAGVWGRTDRQDLSYLFAPGLA
jgi:hypothetical protein